MSYQTYTTDALVVSVKDRVGSDRMIKLFTKDAGMLEARASGIRDEKSKLRYALQPFSRTRVTLVRGKREWRLTGALAERNIFMGATNRDTRGYVLKTVKYLDRFVIGEEGGSELYNDVMDGLIYLGECGDDRAYYVVLYRMLTELGYVAPEGTLKDVARAPSTMTACSLVSDQLTHDMALAVEEACAVSHL
jgi:recombinational DNA repair protein (RecF pathway)